MEQATSKYDITRDDLGRFQKGGPTFVTFGETMVREIPADLQRPEMTRMVYVALAGSEFSMAVLLSRLGIPVAYITRVPDNPYGWMLRDTARANGVNTDHFVWAHKSEPIGRYIYEQGHTPRASLVWYQRMFSAASRLASGMVDWGTVLRHCKLLHVSGISFGLASHSGYSANYLLGAFHEALTMKPADCWVGIDFNYRSTLWSAEECARTLTPLVENHVDILITSTYDMARFYGIGCGRYNATQVLNGEADDLDDEDLRAFGRTVIDRFNLRTLAITMRQPESSETHLWEAAAFDREDNFYRSKQPRPITLLDRIGGGDAWSSGFYYGLLTEDCGADQLEKGVLVGDAATRLKQTIMFDLPIIQPAEVQALLLADLSGSEHQTVR